MLLGVTVALSGEYGANGLWFEDEESSMSVSEFKYAVYSGKVWNECVELDDELFLIDEGDGLWLSILMSFYFNTVEFQVFVSIIISFLFLYSNRYLLLFIFKFFSAGFCENEGLSFSPRKRRKFFRGCGRKLYLS